MGPKVPPTWVTTFHILPIDQIQIQPKNKYTPFVFITIMIFQAASNFLTFSKIQPEIFLFFRLISASKSLIFFQIEPQ